MNNKDTLYVIGNGFDLHHSMRTSYTDFHEYIKKKPIDFKNLHDFYGNKVETNMWWCNFEEMLGNIDYNNLLGTMNGLAVGSSRIEAFLKNNLPVLFGNWIKQIDSKITQSMIDEQLRIDTNAYFFTFNYTMSLEKIYKVNPSNVWHVHNSIVDFDKGDNLIVGHDADERKLFSLLCEYRQKQNIERFDIADNIMQGAAKGIKGVNDRIQRNGDRFYDKYSNINHFVAMGFSFNKIDMPYIDKIIAINANIQNTDWTVYFHSADEMKYVKEKLISKGFSENCVHGIPW